MARRGNVKTRAKAGAKKVQLSVSGEFQAVLWMPITKAQFDLITDPTKKQKNAAATLWEELKERVASSGTGYSGFIPGEIALLVNDKRHSAGTAKIEADVSKQLKQHKRGSRKAKKGYFVIEETEGFQDETIDINDKFDSKKLDGGLIFEELPDGSLVPMVSCAYDGNDFELDTGHSESECYLFNSASGRVNPSFEAG